MFYSICKTNENNHELNNKPSKLFYCQELQPCQNNYESTKHIIKRLLYFTLSFCLEKGRIVILYTQVPSINTIFIIFVYLPLHMNTIDISVLNWEDISFRIAISK